MSRENILVRPHLEQVDFFADFNNWGTLTTQRRDEVVEHLASLPTGFREDENSEEAKRFDLLMLRLQLSALGAEAGFARLRAQVQEIAAALLGQVTIPVVKAAEALLDDLAGDEWWDGVTLPMLETARRRVRGLVKLIERSRRKIVYTDFVDELGDPGFPVIQGVQLGTDRTRFEAKVRTYLRSHDDELPVQKLRRNRQLTTLDIQWFQDLFVEVGFATHKDINEIAAAHDGLGLYLRSLSGLDREAASGALDQFQRDRTLTASQHHFLGLLTDALARRGVVDVGALYEAPFSTLATGGPEDLFGEAEVDEIVAALDRVRSTAVPVAA